MFTLCFWTNACFCVSAICALWGFKYTYVCIKILKLTEKHFYYIAFFVLNAKSIGYFDATRGIVSNLDNPSAVKTPIFYKRIILYRLSDYHCIQVLCNNYGHFSWLSKWRQSVMTWINWIIRLFLWFRDYLTCWEQSWWPNIPHWINHTSHAHYLL